MLTKLIQSFTLLGEEWVLWILIALSVVSVAVMIERAIFFWTHRFPGAAELARKLEVGDVAYAKEAIARSNGMEAAAVRDALAASDRGSESVDEVLASTLMREKLRYERGLSILGTLGNNAPFIGLFGTVLGIIRAFNDLGLAHSFGPSSGSGAGASAVMSGISGALAATAVGLAVAIPAVVAYNVFQRRIKAIHSSAVGLGHAWQSYLKSEQRDPRLAKGA